MINYESLKNFCLENKPKFILGSCFILIFILGFGTGKFSPTNQKQIKSQPKYTSKIAEKPAETEVKDKEPTKPNSAGECLIKANVTSKIYHVKGGAFYNRLKSPKCFTSEAEAKAAGFRKSSR